MMIDDGDDGDDDDDDDDDDYIDIAWLSLSWFATNILIEPTS